MNLTTFARIRVLAVAAATLAVGAGALATATAASAETVVTLRARPDAAAGWQGAAPVAINPGTTSIFFHYACPGTQVADSGAYAFSQAGQINPVSVGFNGPRIDENPAFFGEWGWEFLFSAGAPANLTVVLDIHCVKK